MEPVVQQTSMAVPRSVHIQEPSIAEVQVSAQQGAFATEQPRVPSPEPSFDVNVQVPNYGYWESVTAGHQTTALNAAYDYINKPEFETIRGYDPSIQIKLDETKFGIFRTDAQKEHLLRSRSPDDYNWRTKVLTEEANDAKRIQQNTGMAFVGMVADADIAVGYGITKVANLAKLEKVGRVAAHVTGNAAATASLMSAGNQVRPMTTAEIIEYTLAVTAGSALGEVLRTRSKVLAAPEPVPPTVRAADIPVAPVDLPKDIPHTLKDNTFSGTLNTNHVTSGEDITKILPEAPKGEFADNGKELGQSFYAGEGNDFSWGTTIPGFDNVGPRYTQDIKFDKALVIKPNNLFDITKEFIGFDTAKVTAKTDADMLDIYDIQDGTARIIAGDTTLPYGSMETLYFNILKDAGVSTKADFPLMSELTKRMRAAGYDGAILREFDGTGLSYNQVAAFKPDKQVTNMQKLKE